MRALDWYLRALSKAMLGAFLATWGSAWSMQHAFLVQNSGWMEPFYTDSASQFKPLVAAVIRLASDPSDQVFVSAFNQSAGENKSPMLLAQGQGAGEPEALLKALGIAVKNPKSGALADTDFREAITHAITQQFQGKPGIVWIFTNNKNSPNNDPQTAQRNKDFYRLLHLEPSIQRTLVFPLRMPVKGRHFSASGMMVYALAYGEDAESRLVQMVDSGRLARIFSNPPARLKPLDKDSIRLVPKGVADAENVSVSLANDGRTVLLDVHASKVLPQVVVRTELENLFNPYVIREAVASAVLSGSWGQQTVQPTPDRVLDVAPGERREVTITLPLPTAQIPSAWSAEAFAAMGKRVVIPAQLDVSLTGQRLALGDEFRQSLSTLFPGDPLSEVFVPPDGIRGSSVTLPLLIRIQYPLLPVIMGLLLATALLASVVTLIVLAGRTTRYQVLIDGVKRNVAIKAFKTLELRDTDGKVVGQLSRGIGRPKVTQVLDGHSITVQ